MLRNQTSLNQCHRNNGNENHWLRVELVGTESNRSGIGARVIATSGDLQQMREILGGRGNNQDEMVAHFGLSSRTQVDQLEIRWPSGQVDVLTDIPVDQKIRIFEGGGEYYVVRPTLWESCTDSLVAGSPVAFKATIRPTRFEPGAEITRVVADLSALGGASTMPLTDVGDGTYRLETSLTVDGPHGLKPISILIDQTTLLGPHWTQLSKTLTVVPEADLVIYGDVLAEDWALNPQLKVALNPETSASVFRGEMALELQTDGMWRMLCAPGTPVNIVGYEALRFAFHPGDAVGESLHLSIDTEKIDLLSSKRVDMTERDWQVVEVSLDTFALESTLSAILFSGNLEGTFYLDDIRLVAVTPPPSTTAVTEDYTATLPRFITLEQNYPNPFNSSTAIRFALPSSADVELTIFNLAGQPVATLVEGARDAGTYSVNWDGTDDRGNELASGVYLYRLGASKQQGETRKLLLIR